MPDIAVVGMACRYPDAGSPVELWENILAQRRAFRAIPAERLRAEDYYSGDPDSPDRTYSRMAAVLHDYEFDRARFNISSSAFRSADLTHWLALDVAAQAVEDAGFPDAAGLPHESAAVYIGNTLTGEFSRANVMRLRWPYVRRTVASALADSAADTTNNPAANDEFLSELERRYKSPFPDVNEDTLAGGMSNTIAGRISNHFDLNGGAYSVDGACASSLLSIATACSALTAGDLDLAIAGGVDLSLDPFELVGFAKAGALARDEMRVYDARSSGFWPGEGCGMVVLMRHEDAIAQGRRIYASVRGWGVSSDGSGAITRPKVEGQLLALRRAYTRAGFGPDSVAYFEGHGTGTQVGDTVELKVLTRALTEAGADVPAVLGSIKANIGHTKAAAGVAGFIKAALAVHHRILPPMTGTERPHPELSGPHPALRIARSPEPWPEDRNPRAAVSAMGFGGINAHLVLEGASASAPAHSRVRALAASAQDGEVFLFAGETESELRTAVERTARFAPLLSYSELADLSAELHRRLTPGPHRAAVVASTPMAFAERMERLRANLTADTANGIYVGNSASPPRIGFLFPGQGAPSHLTGGIWRRRFPCVAELYRNASLPESGDASYTAIAQPAIAAASLAALGVLGRLGIQANLAIGHSLGELTALHWAQAFDERTLLRIAAARGRAMGDLNGAAGAMLSVNADSASVRQLLNGSGAVIAAFNSRSQTIVSGDAKTVAEVAGRARSNGFEAVPLAVSHAFHSHLVGPAVPAFATALETEHFEPLGRTVVSTVSGRRLNPDDDLRDLLERQVTDPVRFLEALSAADGDVDLWIEVGPGSILTKLAGQSVDTAAIALDAGGPSLEGLLHVTAALFTAGYPLRLEPAFRDRVTRPFSLDSKPRFLSSPCEAAPTVARAVPQPVRKPSQPAATEHADALGTVRELVLARCDLPAANIRDNSRFLSNLHLNSIVVGQIVAEAARRLGVSPPLAPTEYADATIAEVGGVLEELRNSGGRVSESTAAIPPGVDNWFRSFRVDLVESPIKATNSVTGPAGDWTVLAGPNHPLAGPLAIAFATAPGQGVMLCLPQVRDLLDTGLLSIPREMLTAAHRVLKNREGARFVIVQHGGGGAPLARTLHLEAPDVVCCVVDLPFDLPDAAGTIVREALSASGYCEAHYDAAGARFEPRLRVLPVHPALVAQPLTPDDTLLITGGGKGIACECGLALARSHGCRLLLLGRSNPESDPELQANLLRLDAAGLRYRYAIADVADAAGVRQTIGEYDSSVASVTAILHGAGTNAPQLISALEEPAFLATLSPKIDGLRNVLNAVDPQRLRLLITFGSLTARLGMRGEADYAVANHWLTLLTEQWQANHPHCRSIALEWSVWSGVGMGQRLGRLDALLRAGITPIPVDEAIGMLDTAIRRTDAPVAQVLTGRFGDPPTLRPDHRDLPFRRFLERTCTFLPGVELIVEAELSPVSDPYLEDHQYRGQRILPGVVGLEAMAQTAMALLETDPLSCGAGASAPPPGFRPAWSASPHVSGMPVFEQVRFDHPVVIPHQGSVTVRVAAQVCGDRVCNVVLRSSETAFQVDHFRAVCRAVAGRPGSQPIATPAPKLPLDPATDLYGSLLFHAGRFRRLQSYRTLRAKECLAEIGPAPDDSWFWPYLPATLTLGDPATRDAAVHAIQACVPDSLLLPIGIDRIVPGLLTAAEPQFVHANERSRNGDTFVYDLEIADGQGHVVESWTGLILRRVEASSERQSWPEPLLACHIERCLLDVSPRLETTVSIDPPESNESPVLHRPDGKPEQPGSCGALSRAHNAGVVFSVRGEAPLACDVESICARDTAVWRDLLGQAGFALAEFVARQAPVSFDAAATQVWCAHECLKKSGAAPGVPLSFAAASAGTVLLRSGSLAILSVTAQTTRARHPAVYSVLIRAGALHAGV